MAETATQVRPAPAPIKWPDKEAALARERQASFVACALLGVQEAANWVRDPELTRRVGGALGRVLDLLQEIRKVTEA